MIGNKQVKKRRNSLTESLRDKKNNAMLTEWLTGCLP